MVSVDRGGAGQAAPTACMPGRAEIVPQNEWFLLTETQPPAYIASGLGRGRICLRFFPKLRNMAG